MDQQFSIWDLNPVVRTVKVWSELGEAALECGKAANYHIMGLNGYLRDFENSHHLALLSWLEKEKEIIPKTDAMKTYRDSLGLLIFNLKIAGKGARASREAVIKFHAGDTAKIFWALANTLFGFSNGNGNGIAGFYRQRAEMFRRLAIEYAKAIDDVEPFFGFHFRDGGYIKAAETDRFTLYQVLPWKKCTEVRPNGKPILIIPPYVLGASILGFLPGENKSYTHCFANQGIPTYIRIMKDINETPAVQTMTGENDCIDMRIFCEVIRERHGKQVTLNGFCQGGFVAALNLMSGELDGLVDAFITCVTPMDGTRSKALVEYLEHIPERYRDLGYAAKTLPNGNRIVDGKVMAWVYKLKSMEQQAPIFAFYRDLKMFNRPHPEDVKISLTAAALNYWLIYERNDLPIGITQLSFDSFTKQVASDGTLPVKLFGRALNFKRIQEKGIKCLLCYAEEDDLIDPDCALAPADFIDVEISVFPKGHGAIATSWSLPTSDCALHTCFGKEGYRGPVRYQLDLDGTPAFCS